MYPIKLPIKNDDKQNVQFILRKAPTKGPQKPKSLQNKHKNQIILKFERLRE